MQTVADREDMPMGHVDEKFTRVDERFDEVNRRITEGREESKQRFERIEGDIRGLKQGDIREVKEDIREVREGLVAVQTSFNHFVMGAATSWVILMVTILVKG
jgi:hypothetical protein